MKNKKYFFISTIIILLLVVIFFLYLNFKNTGTSTTYKTFLVESSLLEQSKSIECPDGTEQLLRDQKIVPKETVKCALHNIPLSISREPVVGIEIIYGSTIHDGDVVLPLAVAAFMLPSGKLIPDEGLSALPAKFSYYAGAEVGGKLYGKPFPDDSRLWFTKRGDPYVNLQGKIEGPNYTGDYCGTYIAVSPAEGKIVVCGKGDKNAPKVSGSATLVKEAQSYGEAFEKGKLIANAEYLKMGVDKKFLDTRENKSAYRTDINAWVISYFLRKNVESAKIRTPNYNTFIVVKIGENGSSCIIKTFTTEEERPDLTQGEYYCLK